MLWALLIILCAAVILKNVWQRLDTLENYDNPDTADREGVQEGQSTHYNWGLPPKETDNNSKSNAPAWNGPDDNAPIPVPAPKETCINKPEYDCRDIGKCPITLHPDITNYVIKSSVPPCPDMNDYVLKSQMPPNVDLNKYILKSEIPPCPRCPDLNDYIKKSEIPACPPRVKCPVCPVCPRCPSDGQQDEQNNEIDMSKYMLKSECSRLLREQARANRQNQRISEREMRNIESGDGDGVGDGVGIGNGGVGIGNDGYSGGVFNTMMNDIKGLFGNGASPSTSGSYDADGKYSGLTTQGLAVGEVYKRA